MRLISTIVVILVSSTGLICTGEEIRFNRSVRAILSEHCFQCHGPDTQQRQADLRLDVGEAAHDAGVFDLQNPGDSELLKRVMSNDPDVRMPPGKHDPLTDDQVAVLKQWIAAGAKYEAHWAYQPPVRPDVPAGENAIDYFVRRTLASQNLAPSSRATKETLIRRASLDLTGLPPTLDEIQSFLNDNTPQAWERAVDRLLASPRYGEHMARYWLDAARFADTNGYQYDLEREQWVWRDWVINAFNQNMPFDQFTVEQLAGDMLPNATPQQQLATAFHRNHPITIEGGVIDEEYRTEYVVDRVVTTSTVWLGMTMLCSRCHDHKFDPISQKEFYQLFAYFNQVPERGLNGFAPKLNIPSPLNESSALQKRIAELRTRWQATLRARAELLVAKEAQLADQVGNQWQPPATITAKSKQGATVARQGDGSFLVSGKIPDTDVYEIQLASNLPVHAFRLEALRHPSFVGGGTGLATNANFVLSEVQLASDDDAGNSRPIKLVRATADYSQSGYHIGGTIDGKIDKTGWAVDGNTKRENRTAVFTPQEPLVAGTATNTVTSSVGWTPSNRTFSHYLGAFGSSGRRSGNRPNRIPTGRKAFAGARGSTTEVPGSLFRRNG